MTATLFLKCAVLACFNNKAAELFSDAATAGCSGPNTFSLMASDRLKSSAASVDLPCAKTGARVNSCKRVQRHSLEAWLGPFRRLRRTPYEWTASCSSLLRICGIAEHSFGTLLVVDGYSPWCQRLRDRMPLEDNQHTLVFT